MPARGRSPRLHLVARRRIRTLSVRGDYLAADPVLGLPPRIAGTAQDVTAERAARIAREETENRQQILIQIAWLKAREPQAAEAGDGACMLGSAWPWPVD